MMPRFLKHLQDDATIFRMITHAVHVQKQSRAYNLSTIPFAAFSGEFRFIYKAMNEGPRVICEITCFHHRTFQVSIDLVSPAGSCILGCVALPSLLGVVAWACELFALAGLISSSRTFTPIKIDVSLPSQIFGHSALIIGSLRQSEKKLDEATDQGNRWLPRALALWGMSDNPPVLSGCFTAFHHPLDTNDSVAVPLAPRFVTLWGKGPLLGCVWGFRWLLPRTGYVMCPIIY